MRGYVFDTHLRAVDGFDALTFDGTGTSLTTSLSALSKRFRGLPLAGVLLFTDGNRTDVGDIDWSGMPPIYPVVPPRRECAKDVGVSQISISQTNFESAPAVIRADVSAVGFQGKPIVAIVADETGKEVERQQMLATGDGKPLSFRFQFRPERKACTSIKSMRFAASDEKKGRASRRTTTPSTGEQTLANNSRLVVIDQGGGPYRVLYVSGRPNWEFKFLRRAHRGRRPARARRLGADRTSPAEVRLPQPAHPVDQPAVRRVRSSRRGNGRAVRPAGLDPAGKSSTAWS